MALPPFSKTASVTSLPNPDEAPVTVITEISDDQRARYADTASARHTEPHLRISHGGVIRSSTSRSVGWDVNVLYAIGTAGSAAGKLVLAAGSY